MSGELKRGLTVMAGLALDQHNLSSEYICRSSGKISKGSRQVHRGRRLSVLSGQCQIVM